MKRILIAIQPVLFALAGCDNGHQDDRKNVFRATPPQNAVNKSRSSKNVYPFDRVITDRKQRKIETIVIGRTKTEVIFQNKKSANPNKQHHYPISELVSSDQEFLRSLPIARWEGGGGAIVESLIRERNRIATLIEDKRNEKMRTPDAKTRIRALDREIGRLEEALSDINVKIKFQRDRDARGE